MYICTCMLDIVFHLRTYYETKAKKLTQFRSNQTWMQHILAR